MTEPFYTSPNGRPQFANSEEVRTILNTVRDQAECVRQLEAVCAKHKRDVNIIPGVGNEIALYENDEDGLYCFIRLTDAGWRLTDEFTEPLEGALYVERDTVYKVAVLGDGN